MKPSDVFSFFGRSMKAGGVALGFVLALLMSFRTVQSGEVAVVTRFGQVTGRVLYPGASFILPLAEGTI